MRLICPNCDAQYEVPKEVMPPGGRDVQCSNCGQTWFQQHPDHPLETPSEPVEDDEAGTADPTPVGEGSGPKAETGHEIPDLEEVEAQDQPGSEAAPPEESESRPQRRELDPAVADVLRAEAELEARARRNEAGGVESQPDLGLPEVEKDRGSAARARMQGGYAHDQDDEDEFLTAASSTSGSRRDLLPDIEEINSTLRSERSPTEDPGQTAQAEHQAKRSSRIGFTLSAAVVACLVLVYVFAPQLAKTVPQAEQALVTYVTVVDDWRVWLDDQLKAALVWLDESTASSGD
jgi:predicted Zn finger-like uncharacterized protein